MALPVRRIDTGILDRIAAVYHSPAAAVNPHMAHRPRRVISASEKDNIPRLCVCHRNRGTLIINALCRSPW